eukprot:TRINITY_DN26753_c0_g2_i1.p1 TRINITY_DN26753_c0_g2~~TRINITY_DN26753_c0_g2_i1.p1  ORF type:complete len:703 (+),score=229.71 TRINITY_DN26753_c0_g2_i1:82-2109(+)
MSNTAALLEPNSSDDSSSRRAATSEAGWPGWEFRDERQGVAERMNRLVSEIVPSGYLGLSGFRALYLNIFPQRTMDERAWQETQRVFKEITTLPPVTDHVSVEKLMVWLDAERQERERIARARPQTRKEWLWAFIGSDDVDFDRDKEPFYIRFGVPVVKILSQLVIITSIVTVIIESLPGFQRQDEITKQWDGSGTKVTFNIEAACMAYFTLEYVLYSYSFPHGCKRYLLASDTWINLGSIFPFYLTLFGVGVEATSAAGVRVVRLMRVLRVLRSLKLTSARFRGKGAGHVFPSMFSALKRAKSALYMLVIFLIIGVVFLASLIYMAEHEDAEYDFTKEEWVRRNDSNLDDAGQRIQFQSILSAMWWSGWVIVGAGPDRSSTGGDQYPVTVAGRFLASLAMVISLLTVAYAVSVMHGAFSALTEVQAQVQWRDNIRQEWVETLSDPRSEVGALPQDTGGAPQPVGAAGLCAGLSGAQRKMLRELLAQRGLPAELLPSLEAALEAALASLRALQQPRRGGSDADSADSPQLRLEGDWRPAGKTATVRWALDGRFDPSVRGHDGEALLQAHRAEAAGASARRAASSAMVARGEGDAARPRALHLQQPQVQRPRRNNLPTGGTAPPPPGAVANGAPPPPHPADAGAPPPSAAAAPSPGSALRRQPPPQTERLGFSGWN